MSIPEVVNVVVAPTPNVTVSVDGYSSMSSLQVAYHHSQAVSSTVWEIAHGLGFYPNVTTMDSGGSMVEGELEHQSKNQCRVTFSVPISGDAYLS